MVEEHPFAQYVRILGKGPHLSRPLTEDETAAAVRMIMDGAVAPVQLGAFLCLLRVKTETPEELAGFVRGVRDALPTPAGVTPDLDWASYAGKARQLPWYVLSALLLAGSGVKVFMHGTGGHTPGRVYTGEALASLGLSSATSLEDATARLTAHNFAYLPLPALSPRLQELFDLRPLLGVRSPLHTVARTLNPLGAPAQMLSVAHPPYREVHQGAALRLGQPHMAVFKGDGGEAERRPGKPTSVFTVHEGTAGTEAWGPLLDDTVTPADETMEVARLGQVWRGEVNDPYAEAAVVGTAAIALHLMGRAQSPEAADKAALALWQARSRDALPGAA